MFFVYVLDKQHGRLFGVHWQIFSLNNVFCSTVCKISYGFDSKPDKVSESNMTVLVILPWSVMLFLRLQLLSLRRTIMWLFHVPFVLNISYGSIFDERWYIVTDLYFPRVPKNLRRNYCVLNKVILYGILWSS